MSDLMTSSISTGSHAMIDTTSSFSNSIGLLTPPTSHHSTECISQAKQACRRRQVYKSPLSPFGTPGVILWMDNQLGMHFYRNYKTSKTVDIFNSSSSNNNVPSSKKFRSHSQPNNAIHASHASKPVPCPLDSDVDAEIDVLNSDTDALPPTAVNKRRGSLISATLSHLVPNRLLMSTSRRISSTTPHTTCSCCSCHTKITPYWRDGWSAEVMLCNACGLRFQKFAKRCGACAYIPRKEDGKLEVCPHCRVAWDDVKNTVGRVGVVA